MRINIAVKDEPITQRNAKRLSKFLLLVSSKKANDSFVPVLMI